MLRHAIMSRALIHNCTYNIIGGVVGLTAAHMIISFFLSFFLSSSITFIFRSIARCYARAITDDISTGITLVGLLPRAITRTLGMTWCTDPRWSIDRLL